MPARRIVVIGGGITGLAAAHHLVELAQRHGHDVDVTLLEAADRPGGVIRTERESGFLLESGPDNFITNVPWGLNLALRLGLADQVIETNPEHRRALVVRRGELLPIPEGFQLMASPSVSSILTSRIFSPWGKLRMALEPFVPARQNVDDESLASFVRRRFGAEALDRLIQPLIGGIYTADPETLSLRATLPRFLDLEREHGSVVRGLRTAMKRPAQSGESKPGKQDASGDPHKPAAGTGARYSLFVTLRDGLMTLVDALMGRIGRQRIRCDTRVTALEPPAEARGWTVRTDRDDAIAADGVILALRATHAAAVVRGFDAELADQLNAIEYASSAILNVGYRREQVGHPLDAFGFVVPAIENRGIIAGSFSSTKYAGRAPQGHVLLRAFMGGALDQHLLDRADDALAVVGRQELARLLNIEGDPLVCRLDRWRSAMPQFHVGHVALVQAIRERAAPFSGLELAGNAYDGAGIPHCIHSGEDAAERLLGDFLGSGGSARP